MRRIPVLLVVVFAIVAGIVSLFTRAGVDLGTVELFAGGATAITIDLPAEWSELPR